MAGLPDFSSSLNWFFIPSPVDGRPPLSADSLGLSQPLPQARSKIHGGRMDFVQVAVANAPRSHLQINSAVLNAGNGQKRYCLNAGGRAGGFHGQLCAAPAQ